MPATFHSCFSVLCVPELSPRLTKGIFFSAKVFRAVGMSLPLTPAGSGGGSDQHEVVVHHLMAVHAETVGHELFLKGGGVYEQHVDVAVLPWARALPVPTEIHFRSMPVSF